MEDAEARQQKLDTQVSISEINVFWLDIYLYFCIAYFIKRVFFLILFYLWHYSHA